MRVRNWVFSCRKETQFVVVVVMILAAIVV